MSEAPTLEPAVTACFTIKHAQDRLGIKPTTMFALLKAGEIETFRIGRRVLIRGDVLQAYIDFKSGRGAPR